MYANPSHMRKVGSGLVCQSRHYAKFFIFDRGDGQGHTSGLV